MENDDLRFLSESRVVLCLTLVQHLCSRLLYANIHAQKKKNGLVTNIRRGVTVLYYYYYHHLCNQSEARILKVLGKDANKRVPVTEDFLSVFSICFPQVEELPTVAICVPWTQCLKYVKQRRVLLVDGFALLSYVHVAGWAAQRWRSDFKEWLTHDQSIVSEWWETHESGRPEELSYLMRRGEFFNDEDFEREPLIEERLGPIYKKFFSDVLTLNTQEGSSSSSSSSSSRSYLKPHSSFKTYEDCMPGCIRQLYQQHIINRTHLKNDERLTFVSWCVKVNMPEHVLQEGWERMCRQDTHVDERSFKLLKLEMSSIYKRFSEKSGYNFNGCKSMEKYCPFTIVDIEDIDVRKQSCIMVTCESIPQFWRENSQKWSPLSASNSKLRALQ